VNTLLWVVIPYVSIAAFVAGLIWRRRYGRAGWTTRSSQLYESRVLRWGSPMFHFGIIAVLLGHVGGLLVPAALTDALGVSERVYHLNALSLGTTTGLCATAGLCVLALRRLLVRPVSTATTRADVGVYAVLGGVVLLGMAATLTAAISGQGSDYRQTVAPWFRSLLYLHPEPELMSSVPLVFQAHIVAAFVLFGLWPYTRLVHALSAPIGYLTRPYVVYRSRG